MARKRYQEPAPLADLLRPVLRGLRPVKRDVAARIREIWPSVVGEAAAKKSRVSACKDGEVIIDVSSAALRQHLSVFQAEKILATLGEKLPESHFESLKCRVSGGF